MSKEKKVRIAFKLHSQMLDEMRVAMEIENYGVRSKSRWISEAIESLLLLDCYWDLVSIGEVNIRVIPEPESIFISAELRVKLDDAMLVCRQHYPLLSGVQSVIIRTSIIQRCLRRKTESSLGKL